MYKIKKRCQSIFTSVKNPSLYGVATLKSNNSITKLVEKPKKSKSNLAITGLYFFDNSVVKYSQSLKIQNEKS